jgi:transcription-repair coupling factor (superfamily II helicase)
VLVATTVIEVGVDVPNATIMIVQEADRFGLAQLHQLRGRVGRSHHQAYAYLMVPDLDSLGAQAKKRLEAIQMMEELGSGFYLAMHDLEIRGAGEVLCESQSGQIQEVGFDLYTRMLERAVRALKNGKAIDLDQPLDQAAEINLHAPALLPQTYCSDVHERLTLYKRLANCKARDELDLMKEELVDRFGELPEAARALIESHELRLLAQPLGVARVDATHEALHLHFVKDAAVDPARVIGLVQKHKSLRMAGADRLRLEAKMPEWPQRVQAAKELLGALAA